MEQAKLSSNWGAAFKSDKQDWETPPWLFNELDCEFSFTLDVCASPHNAKCARYFTVEDNGLVQDWGTEVCWCNPPYGRDRDIGPYAWARKCYLASLNGATVVMLTYARTDTDWFHHWVYGKAELRFLHKRVRFVGAPTGAPAPSMIAVFRPPKEQNG